MINVFLVLAALAQQPVTEGQYVLVNGRIGSEEWRSSISVPLDENTILRVQKDSRSLFLAVTFREPRHTGLDLYVKCREDVRMLHVSAALSERVFQEGIWSELLWGRNDWWTSSPICLYYKGTEQTVVTPEAFEFQLDRSRLGQEVFVCLHLKRPEKWLPMKASADTTEHWVRLVLN